jgi:outer membrane protein assembly factor BamB
MTISIAVALTWACGDQPALVLVNDGPAGVAPGHDGGPGPQDAGRSGPDAGRPPPDAGVGAPDAGSLGVDGGLPDGGPDAGAADAGVEGTDGGWSTQPFPLTGNAVTYQVDVAHTGHNADTSLTPPLTKLWSRDFGAIVTYPLVVGDTIFLTTEGTYRTTPLLHAFDARTGAERWPAVATDPTKEGGMSCYDDGAIFTQSRGGLLSAFDAHTGAARWAVRMPNQYDFSSPPTAADGVVFTAGAGIGGTLYAVRERDGQILWTASVDNGDYSSPALSADDVYVSYACNDTYAFDRRTGQRRWMHLGPCEGGGGNTVVLANGHVHTLDYFGNLILDAATGSVLGTYDALGILAFDGPVGFSLLRDRVTAIDFSTGATRWTISAPGLVTAPVVAGGYLYFGSETGVVSAYDEASGVKVWEDAAGSTMFGPGLHYNEPPLAGPVPAQGVLVVPVGTGIAVYGNAR